MGVHPNALADHPGLEPSLEEEIERRTAAYGGPKDFFEIKLREAVATITAAFAPKPVIVRLSDFTSNEYAHLLGGAEYEPHEENPMIGWRGASRCRSDAFSAAFAAKCRALRYVREVPSNALLAADFLQHVDGFSIGSNDLTQFALALDRDSGLIADLFDERDPAVKALMSQAIRACRDAGKYIGICGQGRTDHTDFAEWFMEEGIGSISLSPHSILKTWLYLAGESVPGAAEG